VPYQIYETRNNLPLASRTCSAEVVLAVFFSTRMFSFFVHFFSRNAVCALAPKSAGKSAGNTVLRQIFTFFQMAHSVFVSQISSPRKQLSSKECTKKGGHEKSAAEFKNSSIGGEEMSVLTEGRYHPYSKYPQKSLFYFPRTVMRVHFQGINCRKHRKAVFFQIRCFGKDFFFSHPSIIIALMC
jgi:hypothetical protein